MAANFDTFLDRDVESIERPSAPPVGHWIARIKDWKTREQNYGEGKEKTPICSVTLQLISATDDVEADPDDIAKHTNKFVTKDYTLNEEGGLYSLRKLGEDAAGADVKGLKIRDMLNAVKGLEVMVSMSHRMGKEGSENEGVAFPNVQKILAVA